MSRWNMGVRRDTCRCDESFTCAVCLSGNPDYYAQRATANSHNPEIDRISAAIQERAEAWPVPQTAS